MLTIETVDLNDRRQVRRFIELHYRLYRGCPQWVPPFYADMYTALNRKKHPFYEHSDGEFYLAVRDGRDVGRLAVLENRPFNEYHKTRKAQFYFFDCEDDQEAADALFATAADWCRARGLDTLVGPKGLSAFDGYGVLVEGFEHRQMMTMMNYNYPYYPRLLEAIGFEKEVDFVSCFVPAESFRVPERVERIARRVVERGHLTVKHFRSKRELISWAGRIGRAYNEAFVQNWEYYPLSDREIKFVVDAIVMVADHRLIKLVLHGERVVGFLFAFPDVSAALQRAQGRLTPWAILDILREMRRTRIVSGNGMGILPEFQGHGGNALLYAEMGRAILSSPNRFEHVEMTQVAETTRQMRADLKNLNGVEYKNHRVYRKQIA